MGLLKACYIDGCGELSEQARCPVHRPKHPAKDRNARGYDYQWQQLRDRAVAQQPFCTDCLRTAEQLPERDGLQADHLPIAWQRKAKGLPMRLQDIAVRCGACNRRAGAARGPNATRQD